VYNEDEMKENKMKEWRKEQEETFVLLLLLLLLLLLNMAQSLRS
jgi:hypothetical protein